MATQRPGAGYLPREGCLLSPTFLLPPHPVLSPVFSTVPWPGSAQTWLYLNPFLVENVSRRRFRSIKKWHFPRCLLNEYTNSPVRLPWGCCPAENLSEVPLSSCVHPNVPAGSQPLPTTPLRPSLYHRDTNRHPGSLWPQASTHSFLPRALPPSPPKPVQSPLPLKLRLLFPSAPKHLPRPLNSPFFYMHVHNPS